MKKPWADLVARLDAMAQRERVLVFVAVLAVLLLIPFQFVIDPALGAIKGLRTQAAASEAALAALEPQVRELQARLAIKPDDEIRTRLSAIDAELASVAAGGGRIKAVRGEYGSGKTFFARWLEHRARHDLGGHGGHRRQEHRPHHTRHVASLHRIHLRPRAAGYHSLNRTCV
jgi:hypothetical protein